MDDFYPQINGVPIADQVYCECIDKGFSECILYRRDVCSCSYSCDFVKNYFRPKKKNSVLYA